MRFSIARLACLAAFTIVAGAGCETHDRVLYKYEPDPLRTQDPGLVPPPAPTPTELDALGVPLSPASQPQPAPATAPLKPADQLAPDGTLLAP